MRAQYMRQKGFTLIELMTTVAIVAILAAIALPSYRQYIQRAALKNTQASVLALSEQLTRHKARYLTFLNFSPSFGYAYVGTGRKEIYLPVGSTLTNYQYKITLVDLSNRAQPLSSASATGQGWFMLAEPNPSDSVQSNNYSVVLSSRGLRCMSRATLLISAADCGSSGESW